MYRYDISIKSLKYLDTYELSKKYFNTDSFKLQDLTKLICFDYKAHNSLEDALAAYELFKYISSINEINTYNIFNYKFKSSEKFDSKLESNINDLYGIIKGISYDNVINDEEIILIKKWLDENIKFKNYSVFLKIINNLTNILEDNVIDDYERIMLLNLVQPINDSKIYSDSTLALQVLQGILKGIVVDNKINEKEILSLEIWLKNNSFLSDIYPYNKVFMIVENVLKDRIISSEEFENLKVSFNELLNPYKEFDTIDLTNKTYCLTGDFKYGKKNNVSDLLAKYGAIEKNSVSSKLDFLFIGSLGSQSWKFGNAGGKILRAQEFQEKGSNIKIIGEDELFRLLNIK